MSEAQAGVAVTCGSCGTRLRVRPQAEGKIGKCPKCGVRFQIAIPKPAEKPQATAKVCQPERTSASSAEPNSAKAVASVSNRDPSAITPQDAKNLAAAISDDLTDNDWQRGMSPEVLEEIEAERVRLARQGSLSVTVLTFASLIAGAAVCFQVARYGGHEHWVIKRSVAAWLVGMMTAGAMLVSAGHRGGALRFLSAVTAGAAIVVGKLFVSQLQSPQPIEALFIVLAIAGSAFTFMLAEPARSKPAQTAQTAAVTPPKEAHA